MPLGVGPGARLGETRTDFVEDLAAGWLVAVWSSYELAPANRDADHIAFTFFGRNPLTFYIEVDFAGIAQWRKVMVMNCTVLAKEEVVIHPVYLPFAASQLRQHFVPVARRSSEELDRHIPNQITQAPQFPISCGSVFRGGSITRELQFSLAEFFGGRSKPAKPLGLRKML